MRLFRFDQETGRNISAFGSQNMVMARIIQITESAQIGCMYIGNDGNVGYHQATSPQLFLVVQGEGWVAGEDRQPITIQSGQAAFWKTGEWHEAGSSQGMTAIVIEGPDLDPERFMTPV
jgi:quercetin dioxygenase-like cupin family protein